MQIYIKEKIKFSDLVVFEEVDKNVKFYLTRFKNPIFRIRFRTFLGREHEGYVRAEISHVRGFGSDISYDLDSLCLMEKTIRSGWEVKVSFMESEKIINIMKKFRKGKTK